MLHMHVYIYITEKRNQRNNYTNRFANPWMTKPIVLKLFHLHVALSGILEFPGGLLQATLTTRSLSVAHVSSVT